MYLIDIGDKIIHEENLSEALDIASTQKGTLYEPLGPSKAQEICREHEICQGCANWINTRVKARDLSPRGCCLLPRVYHQSQEDCTSSRLGGALIRISKNGIVLTSFDFGCIGWEKHEQEKGL